jgi:hypothetical protein
LDVDRARFLFKIRLEDESDCDPRLRRQPSMKSRRWWLVIGLLLVAGVAWIGVREIREHGERRRAFAVVEMLGGRVGGIRSPLFPLAGAEIRIEFRKGEFIHGDLRQLAVLNPLSGRNWVGVMFKDTDVSGDEIRALHELLPKCHVFRIVKGEFLDDSRQPPQIESSPNGQTSLPHR